MNLPKKDWLWNYYSDGVTQSFINSYLTCRYQCYLQYVVGFTPEKQPHYFKFGHIGHHVMQWAYLEGKIPDDNKIRELIDEKSSEIEIEADLEEVLEIGAMNEVIFQLMKLYFMLKGPFDFTPEFNYKHTEKRFKVSFLDTYLNGMFDGVYEYNNWLRLMDHKFLAMPNADNISDTLCLDMQVNLYSYAAIQLFGKCPNKVMYNIIRKPGQRFTQKDTLQTYTQKIIDDILKRPSHYFIRIPYLTCADEIDNWKREQLIPIVKEIKQWYDNDCQPRFVNPNALLNKYGKCSMFNYITTGNSFGLKRRSVVFPELDG